MLLDPAAELAKCEACDPVHISPDALCSEAEAAWLASARANYEAALRELLAARQERDSARKLIDQWVASDKRARAAAAKVLPAEWLAESVPGEGDEPDAAEIVEELVRQITTLRQQLAAMQPAAEAPPPRLPPRRIKPEEDDTEQAARDFAKAVSTKGTTDER